MERWVMARVMVETGELRRNAVFQTTLVGILSIGG